MDCLIVFFWLLDMFNFSFMDMFDTVYPLNSSFWFCFWLAYGFVKAPAVINSSK